MEIVQFFGPSGPTRGCSWASPDADHPRKGKRNPVPASGVRQSSGLTTSITTRITSTEPATKPR